MDRNSNAGIPVKTMPASFKVERNVWAEAETHGENHWEG